MHDATYRVAQEYKIAECIVFIPSKGSHTDVNLRSTDHLGQIYQGQEPYVHCCVYLYKVMLRWWSGYVLWMQLIFVFCNGLCLFIAVCIKLISRVFDLFFSC